MTQAGFFQGIGVAFFTSTLILATAPAQAGSGCTVSVLGSVVFGSYSVFTATETTGAGSFSVQDCSGKASSFTATLSSGSGTVAARTMTLIGGADKLQYNLYTSSTFTTIWGDPPGSTVAGTGATGPTSNTSVTIYGRIPAGQDVSAGTYSDSITLTISF